MNPEKAKGLHDIASPGPWRADRYVYMNGQSVYDKNGYELAQGMSAYDADLIAAAPELAEIVAGLRYEYAVQNRVGDKWLYEDAHGRNLAPSEAERIAWWPHPIPQSDIADRGEGMARVVRRLAGKKEVVEWNG